MMDLKKIDEYVLSLVEKSTPESTAWNLERIRSGKKTDWNYIDGCMLTALLEISRISGNKKYSDFVKEVVDFFLEEDGSIKGFKADAHNLDDINEGRVLFALYDAGGDKKYKDAADFLAGCLAKQPRTQEGNFWHKEIYPNQVWLDGIYMAQPFLALYEMHFGSGDVVDTVSQIENVYEKMRDASTGLYYHGYDASRTAFWADKTTGCSANFWLRSLGWFAVALADLIEIAEKSPLRNRLVKIFAEFMDSVRHYRDEESKMYWQVPDQGGREGNYLETSGSSMLAYAMLKGARLGVLPAEFATFGRETFEGVWQKYLSFSGEDLNLGGICLVAGLGPENNRRRDGSYEYYISEPVVENDAKGVAPFILAYTEIMRL